jgi:Coenzyme PQQ synthesis protein D (PqqD)
MDVTDTIAPTSTFVANKRSAACDLDGEMVILNLDSGTYFGLNAPGATIWNYIQSERSLEEIISHLLAEYKVDRARCEGEVTALLQQMNAQGLIDIRNRADTL